MRKHKARNRTSVVKPRGPSSELPDGFKMTTLGPLPEEWEVAWLGDVTEFETGKREKGGAKTQGDVFSIGGEHITESGYINFDSNPKFISRKFYDNMRKGKVRPGDTLVVKDGARSGKTAFARRVPTSGLAVNEHVFLVRPKNENHLDAEFLWFWFRTTEYWSQVRQAFHGLGINRRDLAAFMLPFPPLPEQRAIARVLTAVREAIAATEGVIAAARELKRSLMHHLFTYGPVPVDEAERVPLKETEIGLVPEGWELSTIGEIAEVRGGKRLPKGHKFSEQPTLFPYIRVVDFNNWSVNLANLKYLTEEDRKVLERYTISSEDVYISIAGTVGLVGTVPKKLDGANLTENAAKIVIRRKDRTDKRYLVAFLASAKGQQQITLRATKTSQPKLALSRIRQIPVALPPRSEQCAITQILGSVDAKIQTETRRKAALEALFHSLLHHLMTGKVRVNELEV
jgi:type I restriction enzyme S subunit